MATRVNTLLKNVKIYDKSHPLYLKSTDIAIDKNGFILSSKKNQIVKADQIIDVDGLCVSPGWFDFGVHSGEPGHEERETFKSLALAASKGGYTCIALFPNTHPSLDNRSMIEYIEQATKDLPVKIRAIGSVSRECNGIEMADILDMYEGGAVAFSDGSESIQDDSLMLRIFDYGKKINVTILNQPINKNLTNRSYVNEGITSIKLGLKGDPSISEHIMLARDLDLLNYTGGQLLTHMISTNQSLKRVHAAKREKLNIFSSVSYMHLTETEEMVYDFDVDYKISPPLRTKKDQKSLVKGVKQGIIDAIVSNHKPVEYESKDREFSYAVHGAIGLETCFAQLNTKLSSELGLDLIIHILSSKNREILDLPIPSIRDGEKAELTLFLPKENWTYNRENISSKSRNSPYIDTKFKGKVFGTYFNSKLYLNK